MNRYPNVGSSRYATLMPSARSVSRSHLAKKGSGKPEVFATRFPGKRDHTTAKLSPIPSPLRISSRQKPIPRAVRRQLLF